MVTGSGQRKLIRTAKQTVIAVGRKYKTGKMLRRFR